MRSASHSFLQFLTWIAAALLCTTGHAQEGPPLRANQNYVVIMQQPVETGDKIEVIDFFWYGCPYCYELLPKIEAWAKNKPADVVLRRVPAVLRENWLAQAHLYYTLDVLGEAERLHVKAFDAIQRDRLISNDPDAVAEWAVQNGIDREKWRAAYFSSEVPNRVRHAIELSRNYAVPHTPAVVVDGRFLTSSAIAGGIDNVVPVLESLIKVARERRATKPQ